MQCQFYWKKWSFYYRREWDFHAGVGRKVLAIGPLQIRWYFV